MNTFFESFLDKLDWVIVVLVLLCGFFQKRYLKGFSLSKETSYDSALKTLFLSAVVASLYIFLLKDPNKVNNWSKYFISYFAATSLYELLVTPFLAWIKSKTGEIDKP